MILLTQNHFNHLWRANKFNDSVNHYILNRSEQKRASSIPAYNSAVWYTPFSQYPSSQTQVRGTLPLANTHPAKLRCEVLYLQPIATQPNSGVRYLTSSQYQPSQTQVWGTFLPACIQQTILSPEVLFLQLTSTQPYSAVSYTFFSLYPSSHISSTWCSSSRSLGAADFYATDLLFLELNRGNNFSQVSQGWNFTTLYFITFFFFLMFFTNKTSSFKMKNKTLLK